MLDAALSYAARGWPIFPCRHRGKEPLAAHGFKDATPDPTVIRSWWRRWPRANVALATGAASGVIVLDVDPRNDGDETVADLVRCHGPLPETVECLTGGSGRHLYFQHPGFDVPSRSNAIGPGLDLKSDGGYVLLPPSIHPSGRPYVFELSSHPDDTPIADMPAWLLDMLRPAPVPERTKASLVQTGERLPVGRRALLFIARGAPIGEQRDTAIRTARNLLSAGYSIEAAAEAIWHGLAASPCGDPTRPWSEADALKIVSDLASKPAPALRPLERHPVPAARTWSLEVPA